jgi:preprotein translocase subunit SecA
VRTKLTELLRLELTQFERYVLLSILDSAWKDNLHGMDQIRDSIGFRAFSQKDPRIEFKRESARVFNEMQETIRDRVTDIAFRGRMAPPAPRMPRPQPMPAAAAVAPSMGADSDESAAATPAAPALPAAAERAPASAPVDPSTIPVVGRNEPCPCGSGLKYRQCHGKKPEAQA